MSGNRDRERRRRLRLAVLFAAVLCLAFIQPLASLVAHSARSNFYSYILLVPFISAYLLHLRRGKLPAPRASTGISLLVGAAGCALLGTAWHARAVGLSWSETDFLALFAAAFVVCLMAGGFLFLGSDWMREAAFPSAFLFFMIPLPEAAVAFFENASKLASAEAADFFFSIFGTPVLRDGVVFQLPGFAIRVAQECSGIHSSLVLFITGLLAANLLLQTPWRRLALVIFVLPLGVLRNGFRVFTIGWLGTHLGSGVIDSPIHHQGGPLFFALSLIPLFGLLWFLRRGERSGSKGEMIGPTFSGEAGEHIH